MNFENGGILRKNAGMFKTAFGGRKSTAFWGTKKYFIGQTKFVFEQKKCLKSVLKRNLLEATP